MAITTKEDGGTLWYLDGDGCWIEERWVCHRCLKEGVVEMADERHSFGMYAGKYCDRHWKASGFVDAAGCVGFDPGDAGESLDAEPDCCGFENDWR